MSEEEAKQGETPKEPAEKVEPKAEVQTQDQQEKPAKADEWEPERAMATINKLREQEKQYKKELKELEALRADKQAREEAEMTELEKAQKQLAEVQAKNAEMQSAIWRSQAAIEANLPSIFADRVKGSTLDEMKEDALKLAEALPKSKVNPSLKPTDPANAEMKETEADKRRKYFGNQANVFDVDAIRAQGGGVVWGDGAEKS